MFIIETKKLGKNKVSFGIEGESLHDCVMNKKNLSFYDVHKCDLCGSDDLELGAHVAKDKFKYTYVRCKGCGASVNFGQQMQNPDIVYLRTKEQGDKKVLDWKPAIKKDEDQ